MSTSDANRRLPARAFAAVLAAGLAAGEAAAFPAGPGTCVDDPATITGMLTRPRNPEGSGPFLVVVDAMSTTYTPGATHTVTLLGLSGSNVFTGYLVYGETTLGARVGSFDKTDDDVGQPVVSCPGSILATASHTLLGPVSVSSLGIPWTAPASDVGPISFRAIVLAGTRGNVAGQQFYFPPDRVLTAAPVDGDGDGFAGEEDCDDTDPAINPAATEVCDGVDNDCDQAIDEADDDVVLDLFFRDQDSDLFGNPAITSAACAAPLGFVGNDLDCDDGAGDVHPGAFERCDSIDNDCDGAIDGADPDNLGCDVLQRDGFETDLPPVP